MMSLIVRSVSVRFLKVFLFSVVMKVMITFGGVVFELFSFVVLIARRHLKSDFVITIPFFDAILRMISTRFSPSMVGRLRIMSCLPGSCRDLGCAGALVRVGWDRCWVMPA